ncbi:hypothetical protein [Treponema sp.]|uniref:hypothetical protein n=1 Tax=Treponema sp. TaxID=166 RepID=UPI0025FAD4D3|nr:hypothetical protein [Treponema sp.]MCR5218958.1 hypothetical protein [Treponema sp.]
MKRLLLSLLALSMAMTGFLTSCSDSDDNNSNDSSVYALVNIPFADFFSAETSDGEYDAYSSATVKAATGAMTYGVYHSQTTPSEATLSGITCPVKISKDEFEVLKAIGSEVTDSSESVDITTSGRGGTSTVRYSGKQTLFQNDDYSYYVLDSEPSYYKEISCTENGVEISAIKGNTKTLDKLYVTIDAGEAHHYFSPAITMYVADSDNASVTGAVKKLVFDNGDTAYSVTTGDDSSEVLTETSLNALKTIIATDTDGKTYGLTHLENMFWRKSQMGFQAPADEDETKNLYPQHELVGKTIKELKFVTETEVYVVSDFEVGTVETTDGVTVFTAAEDPSFTIPNLQATENKRK